MRQYPIVTVGALAENPQGEILLVRTHKWNHLLGIPGGKIELGESQHGALRREMLEETGLAIREIRFLLAQDSIDSPEFYRPAHMILLNYHCRVDSVEVQLNDEAQAHLWVLPQEAISLDLNLPTRQLLEVFLAARPV